MKVEMFSGGWFNVAAGVFRRGDDMERQVRFPIPVYLIETDTERVLIDTGLSPDAIDDPVAHYGTEALSIFNVELDASIAEQLDLATVTQVVLTHLHWDHAGGLAHLPASVPIVVQRHEWEAGQDAAAIAKNFYMPRDYATVVDRVRLVDGDHDLLGDGSIELLLTPGHTPGHQSVRVGERLILGADVSHYSSGLDDHRFPVFGDDFEAQAESAERLRALRDRGATVLPGHDPDVLKPGPVAL